MYASQRERTRSIQGRGRFKVCDDKELEGLPGNGFVGRISLVLKSTVYCQLLETQMASISVHFWRHPENNLRFIPFSLSKDPRYRYRTTIAYQENPPNCRENAPHLHTTLIRMEGKMWSRDQSFMQPGCQPVTKQKRESVQDLKNVRQG